MRIQAPLRWAAHALRACEIGGDPFLVAFDDQGFAEVTPAQATHLIQHCQLDIQIMTEPEAVAAPKPAKRAKSHPQEG